MGKETAGSRWRRDYKLYPERVSSVVAKELVQMSVVTSAMWSHLYSIGFLSVAGFLVPLHSITLFT